MPWDKLYNLLCSWAYCFIYLICKLRIITLCLVMGFKYVCKFLNMLPCKMQDCFHSLYCGLGVVTHSYEVDTAEVNAFAWFCLLFSLWVHSRWGNQSPRFRVLSQSCEGACDYRSRGLLPTASMTCQPCERVILEAKPPALVKRSGAGSPGGHRTLLCEMLGTRTT